jgi:hypothetical protein
MEDLHSLGFVSQESSEDLDHHLSSLISHSWMQIIELFFIGCAKFLMFGHVGLLERAWICSSYKCIKLEMLVVQARFFLWIFKHHFSSKVFRLGSWRVLTSSTV